MNIDPLVDKYRAFNWNVIEIDGHDMRQILEAFEKAKAFKGKPTVIIAHTVKGKGVDFMENVAGWHGKSPSVDESGARASSELGLDGQDSRQEDAREGRGLPDGGRPKTLEAKMPKFTPRLLLERGDQR